MHLNNKEYFGFAKGIREQFGLKSRSETLSLSVKDVLTVAPASCVPTTYLPSPSPKGIKVPLSLSALVVKKMLLDP